MRSSDSRLWALGAAALAVASAAWGSAAWGQASAPTSPCADLSGVYENKASSGSRGEMYLSNLLDIASGVLRIEFSSWPEGMVLRAPLAGGGVHEMFLSWPEFGCEGAARVYRFTKSNVVMQQHEGRPWGGSTYRQVSFEKAGDGALLVKYSASGSWPYPLGFGTAVSDYGDASWARFEPYKR